MSERGSVESPRAGKSWRIVPWLEPSMAGVSSSSARIRLTSLTARRSPRKKAPTAEMTQPMAIPPTKETSHLGVLEYRRADAARPNTTARQAAARATPAMLTRTESSIRDRRASRAAMLILSGDGSRIVDISYSRFVYRVNCTPIATIPVTARQRTSESASGSLSRSPGSACKAARLPCVACHTSNTHVSGCRAPEPFLCPSVSSVSLGVENSVPPCRKCDRRKAVPPRL